MRSLPSALLCCVCASFSSAAVRAQGGGPYFASGIKVGEATQDSAIIWVRLTQREQADFAALDIFTQGLPSGASTGVMMPTAAVVGAEGFGARALRRAGRPNQRPADRVDGGAR